MSIRGSKASPSTVRVIAERHGLVLSEASGLAARMPVTGVGVMVAEMDGAHVAVPGVSRRGGGSQKAARGVLA